MTPAPLSPRRLEILALLEANSLPLSTALALGVLPERLPVGSVREAN